jgi:hypothetical protein
LVKAAAWRLLNVLFVVSEYGYAESTIRRKRAQRPPKGAGFHFDLNAAGGSFDGTVNESRTSIVGTWKQGGGSIPLTLGEGGQAYGGCRAVAIEEVVHTLVELEEARESS